MSRTHTTQAIQMIAYNIERPPQSQASLAEQAADCAYLIELLGYYDLADLLRKIAGPAA